jgi:hypothetical protein
VLAGVENYRASTPLKIYDIYIVRPPFSRILFLFFEVTDTILSKTKTENVAIPMESLLQPRADVFKAEYTAKWAYGTLVINKNYDRTALLRLFDPPRES